MLTSAIGGTCQGGGFVAIRSCATRWDTLADRASCAELGALQHAVAARGGWSNGAGRYSERHTRFFRDPFANLLSQSSAYCIVAITVLCLAYTADAVIDAWTGAADHRIGFYGERASTAEGR